MPIKSFRGKISDYDAAIPGSGIDTISLHTNNGSTGYKIKKFQAIGTDPGVTAGGEHVVQIFTTPQTTASSQIDFSDQTLLGVVYVTDDSAGVGRVGDVIIFDNMTFNQDIFVTHVDAGSGNKSCNYYIELEQVKLALDENTVATLKDIRNIDSQNV
tara:strand:- start:36 stop:506 length:471 start_codon:yes stop_codon:yes gene_type:complete